MRKVFLFFVLLLPITFAFKGAETVLICMSPTSYAYHSGYCQGLNKCKHEVLKVTKEEALNKYGKNKACGYCY